MNGKVNHNLAYEA